MDSVKKKVGEAYDYVAPKAKVAGKYMQERGHELSESPAYERAEHRKGGYVKYERPEARPRKKTPKRLPRKSQPPGYDGSFDMFGGGGMGMGGLPDDDMFGVGGYGEPRRRKSRRRPSKEERDMF